MRLAYHLPSPGLRRHLSVHAVVDEVVAPQVAILPAMLANLHIRLAGHSTYQLGDGPPVVAPAITLLGPTRQAYRLTFGPGFRMLAIGFLPEGWQSLVEVPAHLCADLIMPAEDLWPGTALARMLEQLQTTALDGRHVTAVETLLLSAMRPTARGCPNAHVLAVDDWLEHSPCLSLDALCSTLGVGARQLRRITEASHGLSPKTLAMKYRALRAAQALAVAGATPQSPAPVPALHAYADQSHAIRDFQRFIGWTPAAFREAPWSIARATLEGRLRAGARRPLVLLS